MNVRDIVDFINCLEEKYPVDAWRVDDLDIWPIIRFEIYFRLYNKHTFAVSAIDRKSDLLTRRLHSYCGLLISFLRLAWFGIRHPRSVRLRLRQADVLLVGDPSYVSYAGRFYNRFSDPVIDDMRAREQTSFLLSLSENYPAPIRTPAKFIKPVLRLRLLLARLFDMKNISFNLPSFDEFHRTLSAHDPVLAALNREKILSLGLSIKTMRRYFDTALKKIRPKAVFLTNYYNIYGLSLCAAARKAATPCVELQHGTQNDLHIGYGLWNRVPQAGFNTLPSHFASWDASSCATIEKWNKDSANHKSWLFGNRFLENFKSGVFSGTLEFKEKWLRLNRTAETKHVLLSLQVMFGFPDLLQQVIAAAPDRYFWWIRFHPMMTTTEKQHVFSTLAQMNITNIDIDLATKEPLYALLPLMDIHVTLNSSVVHEAAQFGIPSIVCDGTAREYYGDEIDKGEFILAVTPETILHALENLSASHETRAAVLPDPLYEAVNL